MISKEVVCMVKKEKFYKAIKSVNGLNHFYIFYGFVLYFRYKSFLKCANQEEKDKAYIIFQQSLGEMWMAIILGLFTILMFGGTIFILPNLIKGTP